LATVLSATIANRAATAKAARASFSYRLWRAGSTMRTSFLPATTVRVVVP
jgi:hypothetical protein